MYWASSSPSSAPLHSQPQAKCTRQITVCIASYLTPRHTQHDVFLHKNRAITYFRWEVNAMRISRSKFWPLHKFSSEYSHGLVRYAAGPLPKTNYHLSDIQRNARVIADQILEHFVLNFRSSISILQRRATSGYCSAVQHQYTAIPCSISIMQRRATSGYCSAVQHQYTAIPCSILRPWQTVNIGCSRRFSGSRLELYWLEFRMCGNSERVEIWDSKLEFRRIMSEFLGNCVWLAIRRITLMKTRSQMAHGIIEET